MCAAGGGDTERPPPFFLDLEGFWVVAWVVASPVVPINPWKTIVFIPNKRFSGRRNQAFEGVWCFFIFSKPFLGKTGLSLEDMLLLDCKSPRKTIFGMGRES